MMLSPRPERDYVLERPGEVISRVSIDGLEETKGDPNVNRDDVQVLSEFAVQQRPENRSRSENHHFERMRVLCSKTERSRIFMVQLVDVLIEQGGVEELMGEVMEHVFKNEEKRQLGKHCLPRRKRDLPGVHAKRFGDRVEEEDGRSLHSEVGKENALRTFPLLLWCRDLRRLQFPLAEVWDCINDDPWYAATEINGLMQEEGGKASRNYGVTNPQIPCHPLPFEPAYLGIIYIEASVEL